MKAHAESKNNPGSAIKKPKQKEIIDQKFTEGKREAFEKTRFCLLGEELLGSDRGV